MGLDWIVEIIKIDPLKWGAK